MAQEFNGGSVTIEDGLKASQEYAPARKVIVTLTFDVAEDENPHSKLDLVAEAASHKVKELLGKAKAAPVATQVAAKAAETPKPAAETQATTEKPKRATGPKAKATDAKAPEPGSKAALEAELQAKLNKEAPKLADGGDPLLGGGDGSDEQSETSSSGDDLLAGIEDAEPPKEVSDAELNRIVSEHLEKFKSAPDAKRSEISMSIRKLMQRFVGEGKPMQLRSIPQENRAEFVDLVQKTK